MNHSGDPLISISVTGKNYKDEWILNIVEAGYNQPWQKFFPKQIQLNTVESEIVSKEVKRLQGAVQLKK